jgi:hypothetical protein
VDALVGTGMSGSARARMGSVDHRQVGRLDKDLGATTAGAVLAVLVVEVVVVRLVVLGERKLLVSTVMRGLRGQLVGDHSAAGLVRGRAAAPRLMRQCLRLSRLRSMGRL